MNRLFWPLAFVYAITLLAVACASGGDFSSFVVPVTPQTKIWLSGKRISFDEYEKLDRSMLVAETVNLNDAGAAMTLVLKPGKFTPEQWEVIEGFVCEQRSNGRWYELMTGEPIMFMEIKTKNGTERWLAPLGGGEVEKQLKAKKEKK